MKDLSIRAKALYAEEISYLKKLRESGMKTAALVCRTFPPSVLAGLGIRPVRLPLDVSGFRDGSIKNLGRQDLCPLVSELLREVQTDVADVVIGMHTCDTTRRFFQESSRFTDIPVHQLQLPSTVTNSSRAFFVSQVKRVCDDLVLNGFSTGFDADKAEKWHRDTVAAAQYVRSNMMNIPPVALQYILHLFRVADPGTLRAKIVSLLEDSGEYVPRFTLLLTGSPLPPGDDGVLETVEEMGGAVIPVNCTGFQMFPDGFPDAFSIPSLTELYFDSMKCVRCRPNSRTFQHINEEIQSTGASGVLVKSLVFCDLWYTEKVRFKEKLPVPVLVLDTAFSPGEIERTSMRVEAFVQSLEMNSYA